MSISDIPFLDEFAEPNGDPVGPEQMFCDQGWVVEAAIEVDTEKVDTSVPLVVGVAVAVPDQQMSVAFQTAMDHVKTLLENGLFPTTGGDVSFSLTPHALGEQRIEK